MAIKFLSIGSAGIDAYLRDDLGSVETHVSGSAVNTAKNYKALGFASKARIWLGFDAHGKRIEQNLVDQGVVSVASVYKDKDTPHEVYMIDKQGIDQVPLLEETERLYEKLIDNDVRLIKSANWIHLSGLNCRPSDINEIFERVRRDVQLPLTWVPGQKQIKDGYHAFEDLLKHTIIIGLTYKDICKFTHRRNSEYAAKDILKAGVKIVVLFDENRVVKVITEHERFTIMPPEGKVRDHHGAMDRWMGTFTAYVASEYKIIKAMQLATLHTHLLVAKPGADTSLLTKKQLEDKLKRQSKHYLVHIHDYR